MSIKYKIALLFAVIVSVILSIVAVSVYLYSKKERADSFKIRLKNRVWSTANIVSGIPGGNFSLISKLDTASFSSLYDKSITVLDSSYEPRYAYTDNPGNELMISEQVKAGIIKDGEYYFMVKKRQAYGISYKRSGNSFIVAGAAFDEDGELYLQDLKKLLLWAFCASVVLSFSAGIIFAKVLVKPIHQIMDEVNLISTSSLSHRIEKGNTNDELHKLSQTFNGLLDRLQESFIIQRRFISNASHELSTPLTAISSQLDVILQKERPAKEYKEVLESIQDDVKELQQLTRSLLDIAKTGTQGSIDLSEVRIDEILLEVAAGVQKLKPGYKVSLNFETNPDDENLITVFGNRNLLFIAFKNIIENGCKYSDDHQAIVQTFANRSKIRIVVASHGDIIAESDIQNIFHPFFRSENTRHKQGSGLGLTLTKRILSLHKASIDVESSPQTGTVFTVQINNKATASFTKKE